jgi:hypothetical protein
MKNKQFSVITVKDFKKPFPNYKPVIFLSYSINYNYNLGFNNELFMNCLSYNLYFYDKTYITKYLYDKFTIAQIEILYDV